MLNRYRATRYALVTLLLGSAISVAMSKEPFSPYVEATGAINLPKDFRTRMVHLGSWFVPEGGASGFHDVYTEASTVEAYRKTGKFPDGATLVKELRAGHSGDYTTGKNVSYAAENIKQWFVMIKDAKGRFPDNPIWGDGWGTGPISPLVISPNPTMPPRRRCPLPPAPRATLRLRLKTWCLRSTTPC